MTQQNENPLGAYKVQQMRLQCNAGEAAFITTVTMEVEKRQSVKVRVKAQWATEEKMRDVLKLSAFLDPFYFGVPNALLVSIRES